MPTLVVGVDPGPTTGIVAIAYNDALGDPVPMFLQCDHASAVFFVQALLEHHHGYERWLSLEQFVIGNRSARSSSSGAGRTTRELIGRLVGAAGDTVSVKIHTAAVAKAWATDRRLDAGDLLAPTKGMNHARDAARHALFCAVKQGIATDPMSKRVVAMR